MSPCGDCGKLAVFNPHQSEMFMPSADTIIVNARVITMNPAAPFAEAVAIAGSRIAAVGAKPDIAALKAKHTRIIDAGMNTVIPGIVESHVHLFGGAVELDSLMLNNIKGFQAIAESVSEYRKKRPKSAIVVATGMAHESFGGDGPITRQLLDRIVADVPFIMVCFDHHTVWANTRAFDKAGIMRGRALPTGNEIVLDSNGLATGELREPAAYMPVLELTPTGGREWLGVTTGESPSPAATPAQRRTDETFMRRGIAHAASLGITSLHNMDGNWYQLELLHSLQRRGELHARVEVPFHHKNFFEVERVDEAVEMHRKYRGDMLHSGRVKIFMDGVLETTTALMLDDYPGYPGNTGAPLFTAEAFNQIATRADALGLRISVHAIGDGAVRRTLDGFAAARKANGPRDSRHRIEHIEVIDPADIPRFSELGVIASMQPVAGLGVPGNPLEPCLSRIGHKLPYSYAWQTIRDSGAMMAFSSDWPVAPLDPFAGIQAAMTARPLRPDCPNQAQSLMDAIHGFTLGSAYCEAAEDRKGMLKPGHFADIAILDADLEKTPAGRIATVKPVLTICDGRITFER